MASSVLVEILPAASNNFRGDIPLRVKGVFSGRANSGVVARLCVGALFFLVDGFEWPDDFAITASFLNRCRDRALPSGTVPQIVAWDQGESNSLERRI